MKMLCNKDFLGATFNELHPRRFIKGSVYTLDEDIDGDLFKVAIDNKWGVVIDGKSDFKKPENKVVKPDENKIYGTDRINPIPATVPEKPKRRRTKKVK